MRIIQTIIDKLRKKQPISRFDVDEEFSISIGEICEDCQCELDLYSGGFSGKPTKCESCQTISNRENKLKQLEI